MLASYNSDTPFSIKLLNNGGGPELSVSKSNLTRSSLNGHIYLLVTLQNP